MSAEEDAHICECIELVCPAAGEFFCFASTEEGGNEMRDSKIDQKQPVVKEIAALLDGASSAVVVDYRGLTVEQDTQLRKQLREAGVVYKVYKNTMVRIAAKGTQDCLRSSRRPHRSLRSRAVSSRALLTTHREWLQSQRFRRERSCSADSSAACRARSRTLHASSSRLQRRTRHRRQSKPQFQTILSNFNSTI